MLKVLDTILSIVLLRKGPQDLPAGWLWLLVFMVAGYYLSVYQYQVIASVATEPMGDGKNAAFIELIIQLTTISAVLMVAGRQSRLLQTLTAAMGVSLLFSVLLLPVLQFSIASGGNRGGGFLLALVAWSLAVYGHIFKHALSITMAHGVGLAVALFIAQYLLALGLVSN